MQPWHLAVIAAIALFVLGGFRIAQEYQRGVVFRLGRLRGVKGADRWTGRPEIEAAMFEAERGLFFGRAVFFVHACVPAHGAAAQLSFPFAGSPARQRVAGRALPCGTRR